MSTNISNDAAVQYRHYTCLGDIPMSSAEWDHIVELADVGGIFLSHLWIHEWWTHFGEDKELFFVTAELDAKVIGFVALMIDSDRNLRFIADEKSDYLGFALPPDQRHLFPGFIAYLNDCTRFSSATIPGEQLPRHRIISMEQLLRGRSIPEGHWT